MERRLAPLGPQHAAEDVASSRKGLKTLQLAVKGLQGDICRWLRWDVERPIRCFLSPHGPSGVCCAHSAWWPAGFGALKGLADSARATSVLDEPVGRIPVAVAAAMLNMPRYLQELVRADLRLSEQECAVLPGLPTLDGTLSRGSLPQPLHYAVLLDHGVCVSVLLEAGASVERPMDVRTAGGGRYTLAELGCFGVLLWVDCMSIYSVDPSTESWGFLQVEPKVGAPACNASRRFCSCIATCWI